MRQSGAERRRAKKLAKESGVTVQRAIGFGFLLQWPDHLIDTGGAGSRSSAHNWNEVIGLIQNRIRRNAEQMNQHESLQPFEYARQDGNVDVLQWKSEFSKGMAIEVRCAPQDRQQREIPAWPRYTLVIRPDLAHEADDYVLLSGETFKELQLSCVQWMNARGFDLMPSERLDIGLLVASTGLSAFSNFQAIRRFNQIKPFGYRIVEDEKGRFRWACSERCGTSSHRNWTMAALSAWHDSKLKGLISEPAEVVS